MDRRFFLQALGCGCLSLGMSSCTTVPITERKQLQLIPESKLNAKAAQIYEKVKKNEKLSDDISQLNEIKEMNDGLERKAQNISFISKLNCDCIVIDKGIISTKISSKDFSKILIKRENVNLKAAIRPLNIINGLWAALYLSLPADKPTIS
mgnify:CR=1 FL=1